MITIILTKRLFFSWGHTKYRNDYTYRSRIHLALDIIEIPEFTLQYAQTLKELLIYVERWGGRQCGSGLDKDKDSPPPRREGEGGELWSKGTQRQGGEWDQDWGTNCKETGCALSELQGYWRLSKWEAYCLCIPRLSPYLSSLYLFSVYKSCACLCLVSLLCSLKKSLLFYLFFNFLMFSFISIFLFLLSDTFIL